MPADEPREPTLENLMDLHRDSVRSSMRTTEPGIITAYDAAKQRASVQLVIKSAHIDEFGDRVAQIVSEINDVPVAFLGNARGRITWPVAVGDTCVVWFVSSSISQWLYQGGIVDPDSDHKHDISDAICMVACHDFAHVPTDAPMDSVCVHCEKILLGSSAASKFVALHEEFSALVDIISGWTPAANDGGAALKLRFDSYRTDHPSWPTGSTKVKVE